MNIKPFTQRFTQPNGYIVMRLLMALVLCCTCLPAFAQWSVTDDETHQGISELKSDINERLDKIYKQSNVNGQTYSADNHKSLTLQYSDSSQGGEQLSGERELSKVTSQQLSDLIAARCPTGSSNPQSAQQQPICKDIVERESKLQNYMIDMLELTKNRQDELKEILRERQDINSGAEHEMGQLQSNTNRLLALQAQLQIDATNYHLTVASYDRYLSAQRARLADYAKQLANGGNSSLGGMVGSAVLLQGALQMAPTISDMLTSF
ncbi:hypothetical protein [Pseudoxanthomonas sp. JBR18]|uniref:hypothetical protein n=1 Tax=Pseudoxanthomonas sp. JBR18 TaxID=2969308 RepID=UPI0023065910|nr:hypothetical protein [Pseudoxanthomonas sp. JBR18]WCE04603.1 hypothetical protein PJ250_00980 [Pseudoxanthomonas sp. JBR18]